MGHFRCHAISLAEHMPREVCGRVINTCREVAVWERLQGVALPPLTKPTYSVTAADYMDMHFNTIVLKYYKESHPLATLQLYGFDGVAVGNQFSVFFFFVRLRRKMIRIRSWL